MPWPETLLLVHNRYQSEGGEDLMYEAEAALLESRGHRVLRYERHNNELAGRSAIATAAGAVWNRGAHHDVAVLVATERPAIVHVHNTLAVISPAVHHAAHTAGSAVVQTLHNFRLLCPAGTFLRSGAPCEECVGSAVPWAAVRHACYRDGRAASAAMAGLLVAHRVMGTWTRQVDAFITLSEFARSRFMAGGLPAERLHVKSGFLDPDPGPGTHDEHHFLYVGRLSEEKGVRVLLDAWRHVKVPARLRIAGDGPLADEVRDAAADPRIEWLGALPRSRVLDEMQRATMLVVPSLCYENFPTVVPEAFAAGLPVLAARVGSLAELVRDGATGFQFRAGDSRDLAARVDAVHGMEAEALARFGTSARAEYEAKLTADHAYARLIEIYRAAQRSQIAAAPAH